MQHQFLLNNLDQSDSLRVNLAQLGIEDSDIHFVTERPSDHAGHLAHEASIFEERDIIHSSIRSATIGALVGLAVVITLFFIKPFGWEIQPINVIFMMLLFIGFGGWLGGLFGINHRNYRISRHEDELQHGKALMLVYTDDDHAGQVRSVVALTDADAEYLGEDSEFDNPLVNAKLTELRD